MPDNERKYYYTQIIDDKLTNIAKPDFMWASFGSNHAKMKAKIHLNRSHCHILRVGPGSSGSSYYLPAQVGLPTSSHRYHLQT